MKGLTKIIGLIALIALIITGFTGCNDGDAYLEVINNSDKTITEVSTSLYSGDLVWTGLNITKGQSITLTISFKNGDSPGALLWFDVKYSDGTIHTVQRALYPLNTSTILVREEGYID